MQYQMVLLCLDVAILAAVCYFLRGKPQVRHFLVISILYAYILSALFPFLLLRVSIVLIGFLYISLIVMTYVVADIAWRENIRLRQVLANCFSGAEALNSKKAGTAVLLKRLAEKPDIEMGNVTNTEDHTEGNGNEKALEVAVVSAETASQDQAAISGPANAGEDDQTGEILLPAVEPVLEAVEISDAETLQVETQQVLKGIDRVDTVREITETEAAAHAEETGTSQEKDVEETAEALLAVAEVGDYEEQDMASVEDDQPQDQIERFLQEVSAMESTQIAEEDQTEKQEQPDVESLIDQAFIAKNRDDYSRAIELFESILALKPSQDIAYLIIEDIAIMRKKAYVSL